ncbi:MAG: cupin domain-containing protein [Bacteroidota bacterium]
MWTESEEANTKDIASYPREEFLHVLNGKLTLTTENGAIFEFVQGDFFILPKGFRGTWKAEGQNLLRLLKVVSK